MNVSVTKKPFQIYFSLLWALLHKKHLKHTEVNSGRMPLTKMMAFSISTRKSQSER